MRSPGPILAGAFAASVLVLLGGIALLVGLELVLLRGEAAWLAGAGAAVMIGALGAKRLFSSMLSASMKRTQEEGRTVVYMPLIGSTADTLREVEAMKVGSLGYMVTEPTPPGEEWAFQPGQLLRCEARSGRFGEERLVAVGKAT